MYSNGSSHFSKQKMQAQRKMHYHSKGKSCGYYMRIIFFFSSLIQSLIIVSLVLFLVYGKPQDSASTARVEDLEKSFSRLSIENVALRAQRKNLTNLLNVTLIEKARNDWDLARLRYFSNISASIIQDLDRKVQQCQVDLTLCRSRGIPNGQCPPMNPGHCRCDMFVEQLRARLDLVASNFTQTTQVMRRELDQTAKERDTLHLTVIGLRRDKFMHEKEVELYKQRCKEDFVESLSGVSNVTKAFLLKVESLFPTHIAFQLTCPKQREHLEQIRTNCTSLSREVEDKFQRYLNNVGNHVSGIQGENSRLKAENWRLNDDYRTCSQNRTGIIQQHKQNINKLQQKHDTEKEALLIDKMKLNGEIEVLNNNVRYKSMEVEHIKEQLRQLNMSCMAKMGMGFPGGAGGGQFSRMGSGSTYGSYGSTANKPVSPALNSPSSSVLSTGYGSSGGYGANRQGSTGSGSSSSSTGYGSSSGYGTNRQGSTGSGSTGSGSSSSSTGYGSSSGYGTNRQGSTGSGSTGSGSSSSSTGYGSSSGYGTNRQASTGSGSTGSGSSSSSTGYGSSSGYGTNRQASTGSGSTGSGSSSSSTGYGSSSGYGTNRQASTGSGSTGSGSSSSSTGYGSSSGYGASRQGSTGSGSTGSGSSSSSTGYGSSSGVGVSKPGSTGSGSSSSSTGYGSSSGVGVSKQGSTGSGSSVSSSGSAVSGRGPSTAGSSVGSVGSSQNVGSSGTGVNKPAASAKSPTSSGSTASTSKSGSGSSGWWWGGGSSSQSKTGSGTAKGPSSGTSYGGSSSAGRTNGLAGGSVSVAQHLQDLQRLINPSTRSGPEDRQDLSRMMG
ncbi:uncharacterized protein V6R79_017401 [Siganus canaliculatus]